jgi:tripartite-type tricarboxylate transporter receptor subunit TctC
MKSSLSFNRPDRLAAGKPEGVRAIARCISVWAALTLSTAAAEYPTKPVRLIMPGAVGSASDASARLIAAELSKYWGQQVVVDNRVGASGIIGYEAIAKAAPDGYTLGYATFTFITNPSVFSKLPYDAAKDFQPVVWASSGANLMTVTPALPVRSVRELIDYARVQPGKLSYGTGGAGSGMTLSFELFKFMSGTQIVQISYKGIPQAIIDVIGGQVHMACDDPPAILPHIRAGRLRAIGVTTLKRLPALPDIPAIAETLPEFEMQPSSGYVLPARAPRDIVMRLNAEINKALLSPALTERFAMTSTLVGGGTPEQFAEHLRRETAKWAGVIKAAGIKPQ